MTAAAALPGYAELHALSCFSFQRGASHPHELVERAHALGYRALALTDECSVAGVVRADEAARELGLQLILGSEFCWGELRIVALARDAQGWGDLCEFITAARARGPHKGGYLVDHQSPWALLRGGCEVLLAPRREAFDGAMDLIAINRCLTAAHALFDPKQCWLAVELHLAADDALWLQTLAQAGAQLGLPLVAAGDVHLHVRSRKPLHDVMTAVRLGRGVAECGRELQPHAERHLRARSQLAGLYPAPLLAATLTIAARCGFSLREIRYRYPRESVLPGMDAAQTLAWLTWEGARARYPQGVPQAVRERIAHELALISECGYEMYFLTVHDIVRYARSQGILCQGRGSAANSAVCFVLGITAVDPAQSHLLFERFISRERGEPPDIDVDFEHDRRETVIQYLYTRYGRERAALTAVVIRWRTRSALRDSGKALGLPARLIDAFAKDHHWFDDLRAAEHLLALAAELGETITDRQADLWLTLAGQLRGMPRHLSQHVGGFVLTEDRLTRLVPVEPAAMDGRSIIQWDKDDLDAMGLLKVDVLALGMLSALRRCLEARAALRGAAWGLADIPQEDAATYAMACAADTVGVFQIESRAQMGMLPRLQPRTFYDLVVQVAIVRPGPIQGGMVHPYLRARQRQRELARAGHAGPYPAEFPQLAHILGRTLGVPIFQEQVMQVAVDAAGFTPGQADGLRRSMAAWRRKGGVHAYEQQLKDGLAQRGYPPDFAEQLFQQILGFGEYGFPESHAASFALLVYASAWLKRHEPACFLAALLNAQPMGFYPPAQLVQDARRHGVRVLPVDVTVSEVDCTLEPPLEPLPNVEQPQPAVRLGLRLVAQLSQSGAARLVRERAHGGPFTGTEDLALRAQLTRGDLQALAAADALRALSGHRRQQMWDAAAQLPATALLRAAPVGEARLELPAAPEGEDITFDYAATGLTLRRHPLALLRGRLARLRVRTALQLHATQDGRQVRACGIVTVRQRPGSAGGTMFVTLEDETGPVNVIVWPQVIERWREPLLRARLLAVQGRWQRHVEPDSGTAVCNLVAARLHDCTPLLGRLARALGGSRDFH
ncbi:error-prone DNA polymerase [Melaminivora suipulveris]|uniref:Error-prone DNA polymerase n=1 Tax=Melaminivora suipulveris TaxID=2109913 RepID=A0A2R3QFT1_9BURK|nr:error-prone DNA polymerase [Melaminivora suipulveris]AVO50633.1 error-prone DNA polymerase [Melaminivora suipulveris]